MRDGSHISPEDAALEAFADILAKKRGGKWVPAKRNRDAAKKTKASSRDVISRTEKSEGGGD